ncbi:unnamed protein product [Fraxinus pennsylvanica]|uniref:Uncharacterized protein n=1 Tax=Fraxinus pennsylvanica TaxID=56036 RepID=A0AAD2A9Y6_9LAMI|nr:unnamed protein product [Fraxinus pennsylvanica]
MAYLSPPCTLFTTSASQKSSLHPFSAKPSHFFTHAKTTTRFRVSCNAGNGEQDLKDDSKNVDSQEKVDRRNMLYNMGSLHGAANLAYAGTGRANPTTLAISVVMLPSKRMTETK